MEPYFEIRLVRCIDPRPKPAAASEIAIAVIEQRPILNTAGSLSLDLGAEFLIDLGFGQLAARINKRSEGGIAPQFLARGRSSICHDRATRRSVLNLSISAFTASANRLKTV